MSLTARLGRHSSAAGVALLALNFVGEGLREAFDPSKFTVYQ